MNITLRPEEEKDHRVVEELTREAFWNLYFPGCDEHLLIHKLRKTKEFIPALNIVAIHNDKIIGHIAYAEAKVIDDNTEHIVLTFGPLSVLPEYQRKGIGRQLVEYTKQIARDLGYKAIFIYGYPEIYSRLGFIQSKEYNITNKEEKFPVSLQVFELYSGALNGIKGIFDEGEAYQQVDKKETEEFDKNFPPKEKLVTEAQQKFIEVSQMYL